MFILNKEGTRIVYDNVVRKGYKVRVIDDTWQLINAMGDIFPLSEKDLIDYGLGVNPRRLEEE